MELTEGELNPQYLALLERCESFVISHIDNWPAIEMAPLGFEVPPQRRYNATAHRSREMIGRLHRLGAALTDADETDSALRLPFRCGAFPGLVYGFGRRAGDLPDKIGELFEVSDQPDSFVPLSAWMAVRCAEAGAWFAQSLASANALLDESDRLAGLATLTKTLGVLAARAQLQYGMLPWTSDSVELHLRLGPMELVAARTPSPIEADTFTYRIEIDLLRQAEMLRAGWELPELESERTIAADDREAITALQDEIEAGARWQLVGVERPEGEMQRLRLRQPE